ncbi:MAG: site-2 protease family protein, partial [Nitrospinaceae bacterium]
MMELSLFPLDTLTDFMMRMGVFLGGLAALIFVHELGHFLAARKLGVTVEKFALGFGPRLFGFTRGGTEYLIAAIPLGGYVKMKGEDPGEELADPQGSFSHAKVQHRLIIAFAGPLFNLLFAIAIYIGVYMSGVPALDTTVGSVRDPSPAEAAGLKTGDRIVEVEGQAIQFWDQLLQIVHNAPGKKMEFLIERNNKLLPFAITPVSESVTNLFGEKEKVGLIGITPLVNNITYVEEGSAAERAGLKVGDTLMAIDGTPIIGWADLKTTAVDKPGQQLTFMVFREGQAINLELTPESKVVKDNQGRDIEIGLLGLGMSGNMVLETYGPIRSIGRAFEETGRLTYLIAVSIKKLIFGSLPSETI